LLADLKGTHLESDQWNGSVKKTNDAEEPAGDVFGHDYGTVVILRIALPLDIPVFNRSDDVTLVR
jgi:hypothetical protein